MRWLPKSLPEGFQETLSNNVITMATGKKSAKKSKEGKSYDTALIMSRALFLLSCNQLDFSILFDYELSPIVTSMFEDSKKPRYQLRTTSSK